MLENNAWLIAHNGGKIYIGNNVSFNKNTICCSHEKITIESNTSIGPNVCIYDHDHKFNSNGKILGFRTSEVIIGENVWIGANVTILRGTVIGNNSIIGAGSVIKGEIPSNSIVYNDKNLVVKKLK